MQFTLRIDQIADIAVPLSDSGAQGVDFGVCFQHVFRTSFSGTRGLWVVYNVLFGEAHNLNSQENARGSTGSHLRPQVGQSMLVSTIWLGRITPSSGIFLGFIELLSKIAEVISTAFHSAR